MRSKFRSHSMISSRQRWGDYSSSSDFDSQMPVMVTKTSLFENSIHHMSFEMEELKRSIEKKDAKIIILMDQLETQNLYAEST